MLGFGLAALTGVQRFAVSIFNWFWLESAGIQPGPLYLAVSGALWGLAGFTGLFAVLRNGQSSQAVGAAAALFLAAIYWIDRLFISRRPGENALFAVLVTLVSLALVLAVLRPWRRKFTVETGAQNDD